MVSYVAQGQIKSEAGSAISQNAKLAKATDWGKFEVRLYKDVDAKITFTLRTSWIPGEAHRGMFRYQVAAFPSMPTISLSAKDPASSLADGTEKLMQRTHNWSIYLELNDIDGFVLRKMKIPFGYGVDDSARITSLSANGSAQMDASEYKSFLGTSKASGTWTISWDCGEN